MNQISRQDFLMGLFGAGILHDHKPEPLLRTGDVLSVKLTATDLPIALLMDANRADIRHDPLYTEEEDGR